MFGYTDPAVSSSHVLDHKKLIFIAMPVDGNNKQINVGAASVLVTRAMDKFELPCPDFCDK